MKKPMKKSVKALLVVLCTLVFIGLCFLCVGIYAKHEMSKPVFEFPQEIKNQSVSALPDDKEAAYGYIARLYNAAITADNAEVSIHTDVRADGEIGLDGFSGSDADKAVYNRVYKQSADVIGSYYPKEENVKVSEAADIPQLGFEKTDVLDFNAEQGYINDRGETEDGRYYFITFEIDPKSVDTEKMLGTEVFKNSAEELSTVAEIKTAEIEAEKFFAEFKVDRFTDNIVSAQFTRRFNVKLGLSSTQTVRDMPLNLQLPYETVQHVDFMHYGLLFTERQIAVKPKDMKALPLEVWVNAETAKEDYSLTFDVSDDGVLSIDGDGVMTVTGGDEELVTVTATLEYGGKTYTDKLNVYVTLREVKTDEPA